MLRPPEGASQSCCGTHPSTGGSAKGGAGRLAQPASLSQRVRVVAWARPACPVRLWNVASPHALRTTSPWPLSIPARSRASSRRRPGVGKKGGMAARRTARSDEVLVQAPLLVADDGVKVAVVYIVAAHVAVELAVLQIQRCRVASLAQGASGSARGGAADQWGERRAIPTEHVSAVAEVAVEVAGRQRAAKVGAVQARSDARRGRLARRAPRHRKLLRRRRPPPSTGSESTRGLGIAAPRAWGLRGSPRGPCAWARWRRGRSGQAGGCRLACQRRASAPRSARSQRAPTFARDDRDDFDECGGSPLGVGRTAGLTASSIPARPGSCNARATSRPP